MVRRRFPLPAKPAPALRPSATSAPIVSEGGETAEPIVSSASEGDDAATEPSCGEQQMGNAERPLAAADASEAMESTSAGRDAAGGEAEAEPVCYGEWV